jgi:hypothetical protein
MARRRVACSVASATVKTASPDPEASIVIRPPRA